MIKIKENLLLEDLKENKEKNSLLKIIESELYDILHGQLQES